MSDPLANLLFLLARHASDTEHDLLAYMLRMAAGEALFQKAETPPLIGRFAGTWDWDVANDLNYVDLHGAKLFGVDPVAAANGLPNERYTSAVLADDLPLVNAALTSTLQTGGAYRAEFRTLVHGEVRHISALGHVTVDCSGRLIRFPGVLFDKTPPF